MNKLAHLLGQYHYLVKHSTVIKKKTFDQVKAGLRAAHEAAEKAYIRRIAENKAAIAKTGKIAPPPKIHPANQGNKFAITAADARIRKSK